jgi:four helix bundle protein
MEKEPDKMQFNEQMRERTLTMSVKIHDLFVSKKLSVITRPIVNQIVRSSASVAANYRAATRSRSDAEFYSKICIVVEECDETLFWIDYLIRVKTLSLEEIAELFDEVEQELKIFVTTKKKMKEKLG